MDLSYDHTGIEPQIPFLGFNGLFSPFQPLKVYIFLIYLKFPIDFIFELPIAQPRVPADSNVFENFGLNH
jgi:hypothetical protein